MSRYGTDYNYADTRLSGSVATLINGEPIYIHHVGGMGIAEISFLSDLDTPEAKRVNARMDDIETCPVRLGYANTAREGAVYLSRVPTRRYKQGLTRNENLAALGNKAANRTTWTELGDCIRGKYPKFSDIVSKDTGYKNPFAVGKNDTSKAWHRHWCIMTNGRVEYKGDFVVGRIVNGEVVLDKDYEHLKEALRESLC